jgi:hypothetical protein
MKRGSKSDEWLTLLFMLLAVTAVICFFAADNPFIYMICGGLALVLRIIQYILRFFS